MNRQAFPKTDRLRSISPRSKRHTTWLQPLGVRRLWANRTYGRGGMPEGAGFVKGSGPRTSPHATLPRPSPAYGFSAARDCVIPERGKIGHHDSRKQGRPPSGQACTPRIQKRTRCSFPPTIRGFFVFPGTDFDPGKRQNLPEKEISVVGKSCQKGKKRSPTGIP